jgi:hypothetical protein
MDEMDGMDAAKSRERRNLRVPERCSDKTRGRLGKDYVEGYTSPFPNGLATQSRIKPGLSQSQSKYGLSLLGCLLVSLSFS